MPRRAIGTGAAVGAAALASLAPGCGNGGPTGPFRPGASVGGYTVLYDPKGIPPHISDGPCVQLVANRAVKQAETGVGQLSCTGSRIGLNVQETRLDRDMVAVWGVLPIDAATVTVGHWHAIAKGDTYLLVISKPAGGYVVSAWSRSGQQVDSVSSKQLPPPVPNVSS